MAETDFFLKIDSIDGESLDEKHPGEMEITAWSWGESNAGSMGAGSGGGSGKVTMQDFHFVVRMGKHSPKLMQEVAAGKHKPTATLTCRKAGGEHLEYLQIKFTDVVISSYNTGASSGGDVLPIDQCSFNFSSIDLGYNPQKADGTGEGFIHGTWNKAKNAPS